MFLVEYKHFIYRERESEPRERNVPWWVTSKAPIELIVAKIRIAMIPVEPCIYLNPSYKFEEEQEEETE